MPHSNPDDNLLLIRCPSCNQRFKVEEDLKGRTVECGGCEHRFRINDEVIVRGKKFYPGERKDNSKNHYQRVPLASAPISPTVPEIHYTNAPDLVNIEPTPPQRILAGIAGVVGMVFMGLILLLGASRGGVLDGMATPNRLVMAGFAALLGVILLVYGNPKARKKALIYGGLMSACLLAMPFIFTAGSVPLGADAPKNVAPVVHPPVVTPEKKVDDDLRNLIGTKPLDEAIERFKQDKSAKFVYGIWLKGMQQHNRYLVRDYIQRTTSVEAPPMYYPRNDGDFLMLVEGTSVTLDDLAKISTSLGSVENIYRDLSVVEVKVNNESFLDGPIEKLNDKTDPAFYELNKRELESIDLARVGKAVKRLAEAEPKIYRTDINRKLLTLLSAKWVDFKGDVCNALSVWAEKPGPAAEAALIEAKEILPRKGTVPHEMIALIVKEKNTGVIPILDALWMKNPTNWESLFGDVGPAAESTLIRRFTSTDGAIRQSAARLLGKVGTAQSLPLLEAARKDANSEMKVLIDNSIESIRERVGL